MSAAPTTTAVPPVALPLEAAADTSRATSPATKALCTVMLLQTATAAAQYGLLNLPDYETSITSIQAASSAGLALLFWSLWRHSKTSPLAPAIAGLLVFMALWWSDFIRVSTMLGNSEVDGYARARFARPNLLTLEKWVTLVTLVRGIAMGARERARDLARLNVAAPVAPGHVPRIAGVSSGVAFFTILLIASLLYQIIASLPETLPADLPWFLFLISMFVVCWSIACWRDVYLPLARPIAPSWYLYAIAAGCTTFLITGAGLRWLEWMVGVDLSPSLAQHETGMTWQMTVLLLAVQPAVIEELAFRGILFSAVGRLLRPKETIAVTALAFMAMHGDPGRFPHTLMLGLITGWLRMKTGSFLPGVFLHFAHNFLCLVLL